ncbi:hypothetical protein ACHAWO_011761 [Cyclotella atomus]|uniref:TNFR-Cys domain-containing protein n=1 Tax=Cyclotella atomus TaxID=382360 RepID=A0ABD3QN56_9STRA
MGLLRAAKLAVLAAVAVPSIEAPDPGGDGFMRNYVNIAKCEDSNGGSDSYWDAASRCGTCVETPGCAFCSSNLTCVNVDESGSIDDFCESWTTEPATCPELPQCAMNKACSTCVQYHGCSWCQSLNECMHVGETSFVHCQGKVDTGGLCPSPFTERTRVNGNLIVEGNKDTQGGSMHVLGPCNRDDCNDEGFHSLLLDGGIFEVHSGGPVSISAADTSINNIQAPGLILSAGDGTSNTGGQGGDITITAGDGSGAVAFGGLPGAGGSVFISGGESKGEGTGSKGGSIHIAAGLSPMHGGDLTLVSGSGGADSGEVLISSSAASSDATSGNVRLASGSADAARASSGTLVIASGNSYDTTPGIVQLLGGNSKLGQGGDVNVFAGDGNSSGAGGALSLRKSTFLHFGYNIVWSPTRLFISF